MNNNAATSTDQDDRLLGQELLLRLHRLLATSRIHAANNMQLLDTVDNFVAVLGKILVSEDEVHLVLINGVFYLQKDRVKFQCNAVKLINTMVDFFEARQLHGLSFSAGVRLASARRIITLARLLNDAASRNDPRQWLHRHLSTRDFHWVTVLDDPSEGSLADVFAGDQASSRGPGRDASSAQAAAGAGPARMESRKKALRTYGAAMGSLREMTQAFGGNKRGSIGRSVHLVQKMVDFIMEDENTLLAMSTIRNYDDYTFVHSVNVAILSICLGARIGLSRPSQEKLGLSALFHDLGKIDVPVEILNKPGRLSNQEFKTMRRHSVNSVRRIFRLRATNKKKAAILLAPFEHHLKYDLSGYPRTPRTRPISLFSRIVTIADVYDAVTSNRVYRSKFLSPAEALAMMLENAGRDFDPLLLKVFVNMLGVYPVGTILKMDHDELGIVANTPSEETAELRVILLEPENGGYRKGKTINLGEWNPETGGFNRRILETAHPADYGIQPATIIL